MSLPVRSLDNPKNRAAFLRFGLKQNWQQLVFYGIVMLLACVLPAVIGIRSVLRHGDITAMAEEGGEILLAISAVFVAVSGCIGIVSGMTATGYVNSRRAIHCYHSLPLTRETLYLESSLTQWIYYIISGMGAMLIGFFCVLFQLGITLPLLWDSILLVITGIAGYLVVFSLFQLAGSITGTGVFRMVMAGLIAFLPALLYGMVFLAMDIGFEDLIIDKYFDQEQMRWICPAYSLLMTAMLIINPSVYASNILQFSSENALHIYGILFLLITAAVYFAAGLLLHRIRKSEMSESSVIWNRLQLFVKYPVVFVCSAGSGLMFRYIFGTDSTWMLFGMICGLILSFMLMNVLIGRSMKVMFKGLRGLGITAIAVVLFMVILPYDVFGFGHFMYEAEQVKTVTVEYNGQQVTLEDEDEIEVVVQCIRSIVEKSAGNAYEPYDGYLEMEGHSFYIDPAQVLNQSKEEAKRILETAYPDRYMENGNYFWTGGEWHAKTEEIYYSYEYTDGKDVYMSGYGGDYSFSSERLEISVYPKAGIPIHRYIRVAETSPNAAILDMVMHSESYADAYHSLADVDAREVYALRINLMGEGVRMYLYDPSIPEEYREMIVGLLRAAAEFSPEMTDSPVIGRMYVETYDEMYNYPLYAGMEPYWDAWLQFWQEVPALLKRNPYTEWSTYLKVYGDLLEETSYTLYESGADIYNWMASYYSEMYIIEANTGRAIAVASEDIPTVLQAGKMSVENSSPAMADMQYLIVARCADNRTLLEEPKEDISSEDAAAGNIPELEQYTVDYGTRVSFFRAGQVPAFVLDAFS